SSMGISILAIFFSNLSYAGSATETLQVNNYSGMDVYINKNIGSPCQGTKLTTIKNGETGIAYTDTFSGSSNGSDKELFYVCADNTDTGETIYSGMWYQFTFNMNGGNVTTTMKPLALTAEDNPPIAQDYWQLNSAENLPPTVSGQSTSTLTFTLNKPSEAMQDGSTSLKHKYISKHVQGF
ncbi:hypothetical protein LCGC14_2773200, partial [marine sediment metagenome]